MLTKIKRNNKIFSLDIETKEMITTLIAIGYMINQVASTNGVNFARELIGILFVIGYLINRINRPPSVICQPRSQNERSKLRTRTGYNAHSYRLSDKTHKQMNGVNV